MNRITVFLAEDHDIVREGLRTLLESSGDFTVVGEATTGHQAITGVAKLRPTVVVMDIAMPHLNGFEATRQIRAVAPDTKVLVLSAYSDDAFVAHMADIGAAGYLVKQNSSKVLINAVKEVANGRSYFSPSIEKRLENAARKTWENATASGKLTPALTSREAEVLQLVAEGESNKQVAAALGISIKTVEKHRQRLMDKLNIHDTAGLTRYAIATGAIALAVG
jgi:DNA-binding NarL/FixJ family response regulator